MKNFNVKRSEQSSILLEVQVHCGYLFRDRSLLEESLTHPSYAVEQSTVPPHNQRLEFLGDSVLQIILSEFLYEHLPHAQEGLLTKVRSMLANESATADYARRLALDTVLLLGRGEILNGGRERQSILGDLFEAFLGAVYLDGGLRAARCLCLTLLPDINECLKRLTFEDNPKGALQEYCQTRFQAKPVYERLTAKGPKHEQVFEVKVSIGQRELAHGRGTNNRLAERDAARQALMALISQDDAPPMPQFYKPSEIEVAVAEHAVRPSTAAPGLTLAAEAALAATALAAAEEDAADAAAADAAAADAAAGAVVAGEAVGVSGDESGAVVIGEGSPAPAPEKRVRRQTGGESAAKAMKTRQTTKVKTTTQATKKTTKKKGKPA